MAPAHLVVDITGHGYGHLAQVAPVVVELRARRPGLRLTVRSLVREPVLRLVLDDAVALAPPPPDVGLPMNGPVEVDRAAAAAAYAELHVDWPAVVAAEAARLAALGPDLLLSDVGYAGLAGAAAAGIPAVAMSSLNWADLYACYCGDRPEAPRVHGEILAAYRSARLFLQLAPHLPMTDLPNRRPVGPVAGRGRDRRAELAAKLGLGAGEKLVLVTLGGIAMNGEVKALPVLPGVRWLVASGLALDGRADVEPAEAQGLGFDDLIRSCDAVVTKPGYGTIVGAVCGGRRIVYCERPDWPETPALDGWAKRHGAALMISREELAAGSYGAALAGLLARPDPPPAAAGGAAEAADILAALMPAGSL